MEDNSLEVETTNDVREIIELNDAHQEIEAFDAEIETTAQDAEVIQNVQEVVAKAAEGEGLSPASAELADVVLESLYGRLGIQKKSIMSLESYNDPKLQRKEITRIACEDMKETLLRVWKAIKEAIAKAWQNIKMFIAKIFSSIKMVRNELNRMKEKIEEYSKDRELKTGELDNASLCKAFSINGKADPSTAQEILDNHVGLAKRFGEFGSICEKSLGIFETNASLFLRDDINGETLGKIESGIDKLIQGFRQQAFPSRVKVNGDHGEFFGTPQLVNNKIFGLEDRSSLGSVFAELNLADESSSLLAPRLFMLEAKPAKSISTLDLKQMSIMVTSCEKLCDELDSMEKKGDQITKFDKHISKILDNIIAKVKTGFTDRLNHEENSALSMLRFTASLLSRAYGSFVTTVPKLSIESVRYSLNYIRASLNMSEKAKMSDNKSLVAA